MLFAVYVPTRGVWGPLPRKILKVLVKCRQNGTKLIISHYFNLVVPHILQQTDSASLSVY